MRFKGDPFIEGVISKRRSKSARRCYYWYDFLNLPRQVKAGDKKTALRIIKVVGDYLAENSHKLPLGAKRALRTILYRWRRRCRGANAYFNVFGTQHNMKVRKEWGFNILPKCTLSPEQQEREQSYLRRHGYKRGRERT